MRHGVGEDQFKVQHGAIAALLVEFFRFDNGAFDVEEAGGRSGEGEGFEGFFGGFEFVENGGGWGAHDVYTYRILLWIIIRIIIICDVME